MQRINAADQLSREQVERVGELLGPIPLDLAWSELVPSVAKQIVNVCDWDERHIKNSRIFLVIFPPTPLPVLDCRTSTL